MPDSGWRMADDPVRTSRVRSDICGNIALALTSGKLNPTSPCAASFSDDSRNVQQPPNRMQWCELSRRRLVLMYGASRCGFMPCCDAHVCHAATPAHATDFAIDETAVRARPSTSTVAATPTRSFAVGRARRRGPSSIGATRSRARASRTTRRATGRAT